MSPPANVTTERRVLDRDHEAHPFHKDGGYEVRAGDSRMDAPDLFTAFLIADSHNECRLNVRYAVTRRHQGMPVIVTKHAATGTSAEVAYRRALGEEL